MTSPNAEDENFAAVLYDTDGPGGFRMPPDLLAWRQWWRARAAEGPLVVTTAAARAAGVTRAFERHAVASGRWSDAGRGAGAPDDVGSPDRFVQARREHVVRAVGAVARNPSLVAAGRSAATVRGLPLRRPAGPVTLGRHGRQRPGPAGGRVVAAASLSAADVADWHGVAVTTVERTLLDLARHDGEDGIIAADAALRARLTARAAVHVAVQRASGWPGVRRAREVLTLASALAESPLESLVRLVLHDEGFPRPELQFDIDHYSADLAWPALRLVLEADGLGKYDPSDRAATHRRRDERGREKRREQYFRRAGFQTERVTWDDVTRGRAEFLRHLREVMAFRRAELAGRP